MMDGKGKLINSEGDVYVGEWVDGLMHGKFSVTLNSGNLFEGEFQRGQQTGYGVKYFVNSNEKYSGMWVNGSMTGYGKFQFSTPDNKVYIGQFYNGDLYGFGQIITDDYKYRGMVKNGKFDGYGILEQLRLKKVYKGVFKEGFLTKLEEHLDIKDFKPDDKF